MAELNITVTENGPYKVEGDLQLVDAKGNALESTPGQAIWLCRCGGSQNKPFCDGTHNDIGIEGG